MRCGLFWGQRSGLPGQRLYYGIGVGLGGRRQTLGFWWPAGLPRRVRLCPGCLWWRRDPPKWFLTVAGRSLPLRVRRTSPAYPCRWRGVRWWFRAANSRGRRRLGARWCLGCLWCWPGPLRWCRGEIRPSWRQHAVHCSRGCLWCSLGRRWWCRGANCPSWRRHGVRCSRRCFWCSPGPLGWCRGGNARCWRRHGAHCSHRCL